MDLIPWTALMRKLLGCGGSCWNDIPVVAECSQWLEVSEDWEDAKEVGQARGSKETYNLYRLQNGDRWLVEYNLYIGGL